MPKYTNDRANGMKTALVIQGPTKSSGATGASQRSGFASSPGPSEIKDFDCKPGLARTLLKHSASFDVCILVSWDEEDSSFPSVGNLLKVSIAKPAMKIPPFSGGKPNNKLLQAYGRLEGVRLAAKIGCTFAVVVRSDQELDCSSLLNNAHRLPM